MSKVGAFELCIILISEQCPGAISCSQTLFLLYLDGNFSHLNKNLVSPGGGSGT